MQRNQQLQQSLHSKFAWKNLDSPEGRREALISVGIVPGTIKSDVVRDFADSQMKKIKRQIKNLAR